MENINELQSLQNAADSCNFKITIQENSHYDDKRKKIKKYFARYDGSPAISPSRLTYDQMNHFLLGFSRCKELFKKLELISEYI